MKENMKPMNKKNKNKDKEKFEINKVQEIILLGQAMVIVAIIASFILSKIYSEFSLLLDIYLIILCAIMAYTNFSIYNRKKISIIYIIFSIIILISIIFGIYI